MTEHTYPFSAKLFTEKLPFGIVWRVQLDCGHIIELAEPTETEKKKRKIHCPIRHSEFLIPDIDWRSPLKFTKVKIQAEEEKAKEATG